MKRLLIAALAFSIPSFAQITRPDQVRGTAVVETPTANQTIIQPAGTTTGANSLESVLYADQFAGADAGAKINAADARLGANSGIIVYSAASPASATTNVILSANHKLILQSPISWTATITLPTNSSGQDISCPAMQTLAYTASTAWISSSGGSNISFHDCRFSGTGTFATGAAFVAGKNITILNNSLTNAVLATFGSTAAATTCPDLSQCQYPNVTAANSSSNITVSGNSGTSSGGEFLFINYTNGGTINGNVGSGYTDGIVFWGGDSCLNLCHVGGNGAFANPRKVTNLTITNNVFTNSTNACIWGTMGQYITISNNACTGNDTTTDVGIDFEGSFDSAASNNTVSGYQSGDLATFFLSTRVSFDHNRASQDVATNPIISTHNSSNSPNGLTQSFTSNELDCTAPTVCKTAFQAAEIYNISGNNLHNVSLSFSGLNIAQVIISDNDLDFTMAAPAGIYVDNMVASALSGRSTAIVRGNHITSSVTQSAGTRAILVNGHDFNNATNLTVTGNFLGGSNPFPIDIECDSDSGNAVPTYCTLLDNTLAANNIVTVATGPGSVQVQNFNNTLPSNNGNMKYSGMFGNQSATLGVDGSGNIITTPIKSTTGARYVCVDTAGQLISQAAACSGT